VTFCVDDGDNFAARTIFAAAAVDCLGDGGGPFDGEGATIHATA